MSLLSRITGINIDLRRLVPGAERAAVRKAIESLRLDAATLRLVASVSAELAREKEQV
jgi:hypothetical protein